MFVGYGVSAPIALRARAVKHIAEAIGNNH
jgi:hypothetical protein